MNRKKDSVFEKTANFRCSFEQFKTQKSKLYDYTSVIFLKWNPNGKYTLELSNGQDVSLMLQSNIDLNEEVLNSIFNHMTNCHLDFIEARLEDAFFE